MQWCVLAQNVSKKNIRSALLDNKKDQEKEQRLQEASEGIAAETTAETLSRTRSLLCVAHKSIAFLGVLNEQIQRIRGVPTRIVLPSNLRIFREAEDEMLY